jgi:hypothetical protein
MYGLIFEFSDGRQWPNVDDDNNFVTFDTEIDALSAMFENETYKKAQRTICAEFDPLTGLVLNQEFYYPEA